MQKSLIVISCLLALTFALPTAKKESPNKKTDKRSLGLYHYDTEAEIGYKSVPVVQNVQVPVTNHIAVPVTSNVNVPVVKNTIVPEVRHKPRVYYTAPTYYSVPNYGYSDFGGFGTYGHQIVY